MHCRRALGLHERKEGESGQRHHTLLKEQVCTCSGTGVGVTADPAQTVRLPSFLPGAGAGCGGHWGPSLSGPSLSPHVAGMRYSVSLRKRVQEPACGLSSEVPDQVIRVSMLIVSVLLMVKLDGRMLSGLNTKPDSFSFLLRTKLTH